MAKPTDSARRAIVKATPAAAVSMNDLTIGADGEPRMHDLTLAAALGMNRDRQIRELIARNRIELEDCGPIVETVETAGGRPGRAYLLNEEQVWTICMLSKAPNAPAARRTIRRVFMAWRRGQLVAPTAEPPKQLPPPGLTHRQKKEIDRRAFLRGIDAKKRYVEMLTAAAEVQVANGLPFDLDKIGLPEHRASIEQDAMVELVWDWKAVEAAWCEAVKEPGAENYDTPLCLMLAAQRDRLEELIRGHTPVSVGGLKAMIEFVWIYNTCEFDKERGRDEVMTPMWPLETLHRGVLELGDPVPA